MSFVIAAIIFAATTMTVCQVFVLMSKVDRVYFGALQFCFIVLAVYTPWRDIVGDRVRGVYYPALGTAFLAAAAITVLSAIIGMWLNGWEDE